MFKSKTVFVVGAGASAEAKLPVGSQLTRQIADLLNFHVEYGGRVNRGDGEIFGELKQLANKEEWNGNQFIGSGRQIAEAMDLAPSIDTFLQTHASNREFVLLGKMGVARAISMAEQASLLAPSKDRSKPFEMRKLADTWYPLLAQQLFTGIPVETPERALENVSFIVFNYDRCLELYLLRALKIYFRIDDRMAEEILSRVSFLHPYGSLGNILTQSADHSPFAHDRLNLLAASKRIRTFSESAEFADEIRAMIGEAQTTIFLGFGFHDQNLELLDNGSVELRDQPSRRVFATTLGLSESDVSVVRRQVATIYDSPEPSQMQWLYTHNGSCSTLFNSYWRSLTA